MILYCGCQSNASGNVSGAVKQDQLYGHGKRVFNRMWGGLPTRYRCTICGRTRSADNKEA